MKRLILALPVAVAALALPAPGSAAGTGTLATSQGLNRPNIVLVLTDDQTMDSVAKMSYVRSRTDWVNFDSAFIENALCCPSRASILTGQYDTHTGVGNNSQGRNLNETETLGVWLQRAGYRTGFFGKYLNSYNGSYVPPGWNDWQGAFRNIYPQYNYSINANGVAEHYGGAQNYFGNVITTKAKTFITASARSPFFVYFAPTATHWPWTASPPRVGMFTAVPVPHAASFNEADVTDKPYWIRTRGRLGATGVATQDSNRRKEWAAAVSIDDEIRRLDGALAAAGVANKTVVIFMTDNGYSFGEHRWVSKRCGYEECNATPLLVRYPGQSGRVDSHLVTNIDVASTIAEIAGASPTVRQDGQSILPLVLRDSVPAWRDELLLHWPGGDSNGNTGNGAVIPQFWGVRTATAKYLELDTGERELYDLTVDPNELDNRAGDPAYATLQADLAARLAALKVKAGYSPGSPVGAQQPTHDQLPATDLD
jgi:arylsulfatase A-like enzyme